MTTPKRRRRRGITSHLYAFGADPALHLRLNPVQLLPGPGFESHHQNGLGVRRAYQPPPVTEQDADTIHGYDVVLRGEEALRVLYDREFFFVGTIDTDFRCRHEARHVSKELADGLARARNDLKQARGAVKRVVEAVKPLGKEHMPGHFAPDRSMRLVHLLFDERMTCLPHHRLASGLFHGFRKRLRSFHIQHDGLSLTGPGDGVAGIPALQVVAPDAPADVVDGSDPVGIAVDRNADFRAVVFYRRNEILDVLGYGRIGMVVREGAVALAEETSRSDTKSVE